MLQRPRIPRGSRAVCVCDVRARSRRWSDRPRPSMRSIDPFRGAIRVSTTRNAREKGGKKSTARSVDRRRRRRRRRRCGCDACDSRECATHDRSIETRVRALDSCVGIVGASVRRCVGGRRFDSIRFGLDSRARIFSWDRSRARIGGSVRRCGRRTRRDRRRARGGERG